MILEQQVCSLDFAKRLKEQGVRQESYFYWIPPVRSCIDGSKAYLVEGARYTIEDNKEILFGTDFHHLMYSAFTVAELGEMLPIEILNPPDGSPFWSIKVWKNAQGEWGICLDSENRREAAFIGTEADARAKMLIYLIENKLISV